MLWGKSPHKPGVQQGFAEAYCLTADMWGKAAATAASPPSAVEATLALWLSHETAWLHGQAQTTSGKEASPCLSSASSSVPASSHASETNSGYIENSE